MGLDQDLVRLVREVVKAEMNKPRTTTTEIVGKGGDTVLASVGNIHLRPGTNKKVYYHDVEIGSPGAGAGAGVYLPLTAGSGQKLTGDLFINKTTPSIALQEGGVFKGSLQWSTDTVLTSFVGNAIIDAPTRSTVDLRVNNVARLTIAGAAITAAVNLNINPSITIQMEGCSLVTNTALTDYIGDSGSGTMEFHVPTGKGIVSKVAGSTKLTIAGAAITAAVPLAMGANQITSTVATGTAPFTVASQTVVTNLNADLLDGNSSAYFATAASLANYLPLTAGSGQKLTGDLFINKTTPSIALQEGGVFKGSLQWSTDTVLTSFVGNAIIDAPTGSTVDLRVNNSPKLTIAGAAITAEAPIHMHNNIQMEGYSLVTNTALTAYIGDSGSGTMEFHVPTGQGFVSKVAGSTKLTIAGAAITAAVPLAMGANQITSTVATGTAPFTVASQTVVTNLNADLLDGNSSAYFATAASLANYLPLTAGSGQKLTGDLFINKTTPSIALQEGGVFKGSLQWSTDTVLTSFVGNAIIDAPTGSTVDLRVNNVARLTIAGAAITAAVNLNINPSITPTLYLQAGGVAQGYLQSSAGDLILNSQVDGMLLGVPSAKTIALRVAGTPVLTIAGAAITAAVNLNMGGNNIVSTGSFYTDITSGSIWIRTLSAGTGISLIVNNAAKLALAGEIAAFYVPLSMQSNAITNAPSIQAPAASSLTLKVSAGQSIIFQTV